MKTEHLFILRVIKYSEADLIVFGLNAMGCKVPLFAKSALKSRKRFGGGVLEATHYIEATYSHTSQSFRGKRILPNSKDKAFENHTMQHNQNFYFLKEASLQYDFYKIRTDYNRLQLGLYMLQLVNHFCKEGLLDNAQVFHLLGNSLKILETSKNLSLLQIIFELRLLKIQGILKENNSMKEILSQSILEHENLNLDNFVQSSLKECIKKHFDAHLISTSL